MPSKFLNISTDTTLGGNSPSDDIVSSQKAIQTYVSAHSATPALDGVTINQNSNNALQSIGSVNTNSASGVVAVVTFWVGTKAQWTAQNIETAHPDWVCLITDE
jgi:hypothetical protein